MARRARISMNSAGSLKVLPPQAELQPTLSICIPTFNRHECLDRCLESILRDVSEVGRENVEVLVADNCSTDSTVCVTQKHKAQYAPLEVFHHPHNIGPEANFCWLLKRAKGRFVWIFGDDDLLLQGALLHIVNFLRRNTGIGLLHLHGQVHEHGKRVGKAQNAAAFILSEDTDRYLISVGFHITFITRNIFNRTNLHVEHHESFMGSNLVQVSFYAWAALRARCNATSLGNTYSAMLHNSGGYKLFETFGPNLNRVLRDVGSSRKYIDHINKRLCVSFFPQFLVGGRAGHARFSPERVAETLTAVMSSYWEYWLFVFPLIHVPPPFRTLHYAACRGLVRIGKHLMRIQHLTEVHRWTI